MIEGAVNINLIMVGLAAGKALAISPSAGEMAAPAITVAIEIDIMVGFSILLILSLPFKHIVLLKLLFFLPSYEGRILFLLHTVYIYCCLFINSIHHFKV